MTRKFGKKGFIAGTALLLCSLQISQPVFGADVTEKERMKKIMLAEVSGTILW